jgi:hypothetical protein
MVFAPWCAHYHTFITFFCYCCLVRHVEIKGCLIGIGYLRQHAVISLPMLNNRVMEIYHFIVEIFRHSLAKGCPSTKVETFPLHESRAPTSAHFQNCATDPSFCR